MGFITIKHILNYDRLEGIRLVTGFNKLNNEIHNVNIIDNPDSYDWFTAGDFLLTTGFVFKDDVELQKKLIIELADLNCAGLGIKTKRYWEEIPSTIIEYATRYNLPVLEIPYKYSLAEVSNIIHDEIFNRESSQLKKYQRIYETFNKCALAGGNFDEITRLSTSIVGNPVIMVDSHFNLLSYYDLESNPYPLTIYLKLVKQEKPFDQSFIDTISNDVKKLTLSIKRQIVVNEQTIICRVKPIISASKIYGYMIVWETCRKLERLDYIALESAAQTAALEQIRLMQIEEARNRQREDFFDDLIEGKIISYNALMNLAQNNGMNPELPHIIAAIRINDLTQEKAKDIMPAIYRFSKEQGYNVQIIHRYENILMFIELHKYDFKHKLDEKFRQYIDNLSHVVEKLVGPKYVIGISNICLDFVNIRKSVMLAQEVIKLTRTQKNLVGYFNDLISYHLINSEISREVMYAFFTETLGDLYHYDQKHDNDFFNTLETYFACNGNITQAAKKLYIHRNTLIYRLEKIKDILNTDLTDAEENFNIQLALKIYKILQLKHEVTK